MNVSTGFTSHVTIVVRFHIVYSIVKSNQSPGLGKSNTNPPAKGEVNNPRKPQVLSNFLTDQLVY